MQAMRFYPEPHVTSASVWQDSRSLTSSDESVSLGKLLPNTISSNTIELICQVVSRMGAENCLFVSRKNEKRISHSFVAVRTSQHIQLFLSLHKKVIEAEGLQRLHYTDPPILTFDSQ